MKFKVWLDSGANCESCRKVEVDLADLGISEQQWLNMQEHEKEQAMREVAFEQSDWGYCEVK